MKKEVKESHKEDEFELDTVDYIKAALKKRGYKEAARDKHIPDEPTSLKSKRGNLFNFKMISICITALLLITVGLIFFQKQELSFSLLSDSSKISSKNYLRVGPISTTLSNSNIIRFSMDIGLENESSKEKLAEKKAFVKNQIISTITKPGTAELIESRRYDLIKAKIQENIEKTTGETVSDVYFSELRIF